MLVLSRKVGESIIIATAHGERIEVVVLEDRGSNIRLGVEADRAVTVKFTIELDEDDAAAVHRAIAIHQNQRVNGEHILPDGQSDVSGTVLGEICRDWEEYRDTWESPKEEAPRVRERIVEQLMSNQTPLYLHIQIERLSWNLKNGIFDKILSQRIASLLYRDLVQK